MTEDTKPAAPSATDDPEPDAAVTVAEQPAPAEPAGDEAGSPEPEQPEAVQTNGVATDPEPALAEAVSPGAGRGRRARGGDRRRGAEGDR